MWEEQGLFEQPFDAVSLLTWSKVRKVCMGMSIASFMSSVASSVCVVLGTSSVSWCCRVMALWLG